MNTLREPTYVKPTRRNECSQRGCKRQYTPKAPHLRAYRNDKHASAQEHKRNTAFRTACNTCMHREATFTPCAGQARQRALSPQRQVDAEQQKRLALVERALAVLGAASARAMLERPSHVQDQAH